MRKLDFYEFAGVVVPGAVLLLGAAIIWPSKLTAISQLDLSVGGLGIVLIAAYVCGHLLQALGNLIEIGWWRAWDGWPSDWIRSGKRNLISEQQKSHLVTAIRRQLRLPGFQLSSDIPKAEWQPIFRQVYAAVRANGRDDRAYVFNGNYGLFRGIVAGLAVTLVATFITNGCRPVVLPAGITAALGLALYRMHRFAIHYAREVLVQFLQLPSTGADAPKD